MSLTDLLAPARGPDRRRPRLAEPIPPSPLSRSLDRFVAGQQAPFGSDAPPYLAFGVAGIACGVAALTALLIAKHVALAWVLIVLVSALTVFVLAGLLRQTALNGESHALLPDVLVVLATVAGLAALVGDPVLVLLDATTVGLGAFLVFGRLGCLVAGCCHGRPATFGVVYDHGKHADNPLTGVRLFPLQLIEACWIAVVTLVTAAIAVSAAPAGNAVEFWLLAYGSGRFALDLVRGDRHRLLGPLTEAQVIIVVLVAAVIAYDAVHHGDVDATRLALAGGCAVLCALAWLLRSRWYAVERTAVGEELIGNWEGLLTGLEPASRRMGTGASGTGETRRGPLTVSLVIDPLDDGYELHAFSLRGEGWTLEESDAVAMSGVIPQRLPEHRVVRAEACEPDTFHLWAICDPRTAPGSTIDDERYSVYQRARAAARETFAVEPPPPGRPPDPSLMPPR